MNHRSSNPIEIDPDLTLSLLRDMVRIDSVLPHERELAVYIATQLETWGLPARLDEVVEGRPNVYASFPMDASRPFLVFSGHSDTVPAAADWQTNPLEPVEQAGCLHGLGAINMKAGLACMLSAFKAFADAYRARRLGPVAGTLGLAITVDQEGHSLGANALLGTKYGECDAMLHAEHFFGSGPDDYLPVAGTGKVLYRLTVRGRAAHAFRPEEGGINAVADGARIVQALHALPLRQDPVLGQGTVCVLRMEGGASQYAMVVPERCEVLITRLTVPGESRDVALGDIQNLITPLGLESQVDIEMPPPSYAPYVLNRDDPVVVSLLDSFKHVYRSIVGKRPHFAGHRGVTDANVYVADAGIPTLVFGPKGGRHHQAGEYVEVASLGPVARIYAETARSFLQPKSRP